MKILKLNSLVFALFCVIALLAMPTRSQTINLDPNFNAGVSEGVVQVFATAVQPDGKILVGGGFSLANGFERNTLVRLNRDGTLDTTFNMGGVGPSSSVYEIVVLKPDNKILIGGTFTTYNGVPTPAGLIRLNANGSIDSTFNAGGAGINNGNSIGSVQTISAQSDGKFLISGSFTSYNGSAISSVARINADGTLDTSFTPHFPSGAFVEEVDVQDDQHILVAGAFAQYGNQPRNGIARLNPDGSLDPTFVPATNPNDAFYGMTIQSDKKILIGGSGDQGGTFNSIIKRLNPDGSNDTSFIPPTLTGGSVEYFAVHPENGSILVAGRFNTASMPNVGLLRLESTGKLDSTFQLESADNYGYHVALQPDDNKIIFSGLFIRYGGQTRKQIVRLNSDGTVDSSFSPTLVGWGYAIAMAQQQPNDKIVVGGNFLTANGASRVNVARFNSNGTIDSTFIGGAGTLPDPNNGSNIINAVAVQNDDKKILIAGLFGGYNGTARRCIARLNANGTLDATFNAAFLASAISITINDILVLPSGKILVAGGAFFNQSSIFLFRLNSDGSLDNTFNQGKFTANGSVRKIVRHTDGTIYAVGSFSSYNTVARQRIVKIDENGTLDISFNSQLGANAIINDVALQGDKVLIAGTFTNYAGVPINRIARLNADGTLDASFNVGTGFNGNVESIAVQPVSNRIFVGGRFSNYNGAAANRFAALNSDGSLSSELGSGFNTDPRFFVRKLLLQADGQLLVSGLLNKYNNTLKSGILRLITAPTASSLTISGNVKVDNANLAGANVTLSGDGNSVVTTDANGNYSFGNLTANGSYTVGVNKTGYNFPLGSQSFSNLQTNQTADFTGAQLCQPPPSGGNGTGACQNATETPVSTNNEPISVTMANEVSLTFGDVETSGTTVATEVAPESTGALPNSYTFLAGETAYDVRTSAGFAGSIEVCFPVTTVNDPAVFSRLAVLHNENGNLIDRTSIRDFAARKICASVTSLSPFAFAEKAQPTKASVSGLIAYGTSPANQTQKFVSGVVFTATGTAPATTTSNSLGTYLLGDLNAGGQYTVTLSKTGNANGITAFDATLVLRHVAAGGQGANALNTNQQLAANTDSDNSVTAFDATLILRYVAANGGNANTGQTGKWKFSPESQTYSALNNSLENENYTAILKGDVDGDWAPSENGSLAENENKTLPSIETSEEKTLASKSKNETEGNIITIPVNITADAGENVSAYSFAVTFDPNVLQPANSAINVSGTLGSGFQIFADKNTPGRLGIAAASGQAKALTNGTLLYLSFKVVGKQKERSKTTMINLGFADSVFKNDKGASVQTGLSKGVF